MSLTDKTRHSTSLEGQSRYEAQPRNRNQTQPTLDHPCQQPQQTQSQIHDARQREYHQRMVEHVRNTALDNLDLTSFHLPPSTSAYTSPPEHTHTPTDSQASTGQYAPTLCSEDFSNDTSTSASTSASLPSPSGMFLSNGGMYDHSNESGADYNPRRHSSITSGASGSGLFTEPFDMASAPSMDSAPYHSMNAAGQGYLSFGGLAAGDAAMSSSMGMPQSGFEKISNDHNHLLAFPNTGAALNTYAPQPMFTMFNDIGSFGMSPTGAFGFANPPLPQAYGGDMFGLQHPSAPEMTADSFAGRGGITSVNPTFLHTSAPAACPSYDNGQSPIDGDIATRPQTVDHPGSPLRAVSPGSPILGVSAPVPHDRRASESALQHEMSSHSLPRTGHKRKMTWSPSMAREGPNISQAQKELELAELARLESGGPELKDAKRKLQNRLAQRAFRARSKATNSAAASHLTDLENLADLQAKEIRLMELTMAKLQAENVQLRAEKQERHRIARFEAQAKRRRSSRERSPAAEPFK